MSNVAALPPLTVVAVTTIADRGVAVFFEGDPPVTLRLGNYHVRLDIPGRASLETSAALEAARKIPPGEVLAFLFRGLRPEDIPVGSKVTVVRPV